MKAIYPEAAKELAYDRPFEKNYLLFNDLCNRLKKQFSVQPQELDILLTVLGKQERVKAEEEVEKAKVIDKESKGLIVKKK